MKPDVVIAISHDYLGENSSTIGVVYDQHDHPIPIASPSDLRGQLEAETQRSLKRLSSFGGKVVMVEPVPTTTKEADPYVCLTKSSMVEACRFVTSEAPSTLEALFRKLRGQSHVLRRRTSTGSCVPSIRFAIRSSITRSSDSIGEHITARFAVSIAAAVNNSLTSAGVLHESIPEREVAEGAGRRSTEHHPGRVPRGTNREVREVREPLSTAYHAKPEQKAKRA